MKVRVGVSCGDLHGIGLEVVLKALASDAIDTSCVNIYAPNEAVHSVANSLGLVSRARVVDLGYLNSPLSLGTPTTESAQWAVRSLSRSCDDLLSGDLDVLVTAPIDKQAVDGVGFRFPGHTEYLAERAGNPPYLMFLVSDKLRVGTITGHMPLAAVSKAINKKLIVDRVQVMHRSLVQDFGIADPKIALLGLNPHAGDQGRLGEEEGSIITPAVSSLRDQGVSVAGPFPADGFFGSQQNQQFDGVMSMYHDQGLVPFKALTFGEGVNFTAGLPFVRTSPDHGTAFGIAGKNEASEQSMLNAIRTGIQVFMNRSIVS